MIFCTAVFHFRGQEHADADTPDLPLCGSVAAGNTQALRASAVPMRAGRAHSRGCAVDVEGEESNTHHVRSSGTARGGTDVGRQLEAAALPDWKDEPGATGRLAPAQEIILSCFVSHLPDKPRYYSRLHKI